MASVLRTSANPLYTVSKHGVYGLVRQHDQKMQQKTGIKMLGLGPYIVDTPLVRTAMKVPDGKELKSQFGQPALSPNEVRKY